MVEAVRVVDSRAWFMSYSALWTAVLQLGRSLSLTSVLKPDDEQADKKTQNTSNSGSLWERL